MKDKKLAIVNLISLLFVFLFNFLTGSGYINGLSQQAISDKYTTLITPSGYAFSIWGVIYTLVAIAIILMLMRYREQEYSDTIHAISYWFLLSSIANVLWTISFSYLQIALSTVLIFILLISLVMILKNISKLDSSTKAIFPLAFGLYAGWVLIASVLNVAVTLVKVEWSAFGLSPSLWANIILIVAIFIVFIVTYYTKNIIIPLPVAWAYFAIYTKEGLVVALIGIVFLLGTSLYQFIKNGYKIQT